VIGGAIVAAPPRGASFEGGPIRLLCVGSQASQLERTRRVLGPRFVIDTSLTTVDCLARLARDPFDVLLLLGRPTDSSTLELLRTIRSRPLEAPVVLVLAESEERLVGEALGLGVYDCLIERPADLARLPRVLENATTLHRTAPARAGFVVVGQILAEIAGGLDGVEALRRIARAAGALAGTERALILLLEKGEALVPRVWSGFKPRALAGTRLPAQAGVWADALAARGAVRIDPVALAEPWSAAPLFLELAASLAIPVGAQGRALGLLIVPAPDRPLADGEEAALRALADLAGAALENLRLTGELLHAQRLSTVGRMVAGIAHELNNPLAVILGTLDLLRHEVTADRTAERLGRVSAQAQRAVKIVRTLLALARKRPAQQVAVDLNDVVAETLELAAYDLKHADIRIVERFRDDLPAVTGDRDQLQQVFTNLVLNASQAIRESGRGGTLTVTTDVDRITGRAVVTVADSGPGIRPEHLTRVFEPFFTTKPDGQGTGLGLAICRRIVENHGGRISVASRQGGGAEFTVELPAGRPVHAPGPDAPPDPAPAGPGVRVLVVEDEPLVADMVEDLLALEGHQVDRATNGREALERVQSRAYALIVSDVRMPDLSGSAFYRELTRLNPAMARRVVFVTGDVVSPETRAFLDETGLTYLEKPFPINDFQSAVRRALAAD
jgi:signal transduction histidine kinase